MPDELDAITNAEREARRDRPRDALSLLCQAAVAQHHMIVDLTERLEGVEHQLAALTRTWLASGGT